MTIGLWLPQLLFLAIILSATLTRAQTPRAANDFVDTAKCYDGLDQADANGDNRVERDEYLTFVKSIGPPGFLADIDSILDAPLTLQGSFRTLACICGQNGGDAQCCLGDNAHIPIDINNPDSNTLPFLFLVCSLTSRSIDLVLEEPPPSSISTSPTTSPTIYQAPSPMPSNSAVPTATATATATQEPTRSPSSSPSTMPTTSPRPTTSPSSSPPSSSPSAIPTTAPRPTTSPSAPPPSSSPSAIWITSPRPTIYPSSSPISIPSAVPSNQPSAMPTGEEIGVVARTIYTVVVVNGITENVPEASYVLDLIASMNVVAVEVASEVDFGGTRSNGSSRRRLEVRVSLPTFIDRVVDAGGFTDTPEFVDGVFELGACPSDLANPDNDKCEQVTASVGLFLDDEAPQAARQLYQTALDRAIVEGRLQDALMEINPDSPVRIITGKSPGTNGVTSRYTVGIVIGAVAVLGLMVAILIVRKRKRKRAFDELQPVSSIPFGKEFEPDSTGTEELDSAERQRTDEEAGTVQSGNATLGATKAYYGQPSSDDGMQSYIGGRSRESSTASAGMSSINSDSASSNEVEASTFGTKMPDPDTAIVAEDEDARGATADYQSSFSSIQSSIQTGDSSLKVRMDEQKAAELYRLIEGGDWEGILMHADSKLSKNDKSLDVSISSHQQDSQGSASGAVAADEPKAAELHRLINRGDWEGVIRAASTFSSDGKSLGGSLSHPGSRGFASVAESSPPSIASSSVEGLASGSAIGSGITPHTFQSSTLSTGTSKNRDRAELSRQVEELFQLYTLVEGKIEGTKRRASTFSRDEKALDGSILSHLGSPGSASGAVLMDAPKASKLHRLIQAGDWEGVRRAATTLSLSSDDKSLDGSILSHQDSQGSASNADLVDEPKASELHRLIQARDWEGVRRAASTFSSDDKSLDGSLSDPGSGGFSFGAESSHLSIASSSVEGSASGSTTGWGITPHTFQSSTLSTGTSKNRDRAELSRQVEELFQLYTLVDGRVTEGAIRAASTFSRDDKSLDGSILSHLGSPGSASGAVLEDEPQAAELHRLIQVGDWEGVRRAATTFSSDGKSLDGSILSHQDSQGSASNAVLVDEPKASELDRLIQVRDWEGVRRAATAFSSDDKSLDGSLLSRLGSPRSASGAESSHRSIASASIEGSASRSTTGPGTTPHTFTSSTPSTGTSTNRDRAGLRRNVEELIHRMAPEETEHVDETMLQFKGREDELLETLRTMQERLIAHKARATSNKQVKLETKK